MIKGQFRTRHSHQPLRPNHLPWHLRRESMAQFFFTAHAFLAVVILGLITLFLFREGSGFFRMNYEHLTIYRQSGLEPAAHLKQDLEDFRSLRRFVENKLAAGIEDSLHKGKGLEEAHRLVQADKILLEDLLTAIEPLEVVYFRLRDQAMRLRDDALVYENSLSLRRQLEEAAAQHGREGLNLEELRLSREANSIELQPVDFQTRTDQIRQTIGQAHTALETVAASLRNLKRSTEPPASRKQDPQASRINQLIEMFASGLPQTAEALDQWDPQRPIQPLRAVSSFLFGTKWITNSFFQDWFGLLPLLAGSLVVAIIALTIAVPLGVGAAIYVNKVATPKEQAILKPSIEFIAALPSVVIGFFGVAVWGEFVRWVSQFDGLAWLPFFPLAERLNAFTAGCLLALMAIPTIFTLAEDALNNVPATYQEGSYALGATRWQTTLHIVIPGALSGIISAVLLGFGRVIGETMVVLLCAGNRIDIPDLTSGLGVFFEPVHTMTGIIAQEMGEVVQGSLHYRALFVVGLVLFLISLTVNFTAQRILRRKRMPSS